MSSLSWIRAAVLFRPIIDKGCSEELQLAFEHGLLLDEAYSALLGLPSAGDEGLPKHGPLQWPRTVSVDSCATYHHPQTVCCAGMVSHHFSGIPHTAQISLSVARRRPVSITPSQCPLAGVNFPPSVYLSRKWTCFGEMSPEVADYTLKRVRNRKIRWR